LIGLCCPTCNVNFEKDDQFKLHYHSDIHHYNMKRKIVGLKPATEEQFLKQIQKMQIEKEKTAKIQQSYYCDVLNQKFCNYTTFANRLTTKRYLKVLDEKKNKSTTPSDQKVAEPVLAEPVLADKPENGSETMAQANFKKKATVPSTLESLNICLFTNVMFESFEANLEQMRKKYGFFILDERCCVKKPELIKYLAKVIQKEFSCIYCQTRFKNADSTQRHIISKQHALMNSDYFGPYEKFYDFRAENRKVALELQERFKDVKTDNQFVYSIKNRPEPAAIAAAPADPATEIAEDVQEDGEWEDDEDDHDDLLTEKYNIRKVKRLDTGELLLPSGKIAGHRKYKIYYKQRLRLRDPETDPVRHLMSDPGLQRKLLRQEQAMVLKIASLPGNGGSQLALNTYHNFLKNMRKKADHANHETYDRLQTNWVKLGISHNKLQKHFRNRNVVFG
jgi:pre-60S factor REI1